MKSHDQKKNCIFWEGQADKYSGHMVSWWDINMKKIEVKNIVPYLTRKDLVLDVGCSNGASTLDIHKAVGCRIHGIDYSKKAIKQAQKIKNELLQFEYADILSFSSPIKYDKAVSIRCLINLMTKKDQLQALSNIRNLLKDKGLYIMSEAFMGALNNLNKARKLFSLKPLVQPKYNNYFREEQFKDMIKDKFKILEIKNFSSPYYLGTRLFQYLVMDDEPRGHDTKLHRFFAQYDRETQNSGDFGPQKIYILQKK
jgi:cyclopropane fatty-acyl-phospholipid synthase-like methyltransferase